MFRTGGRHEYAYPKRFPIGSVVRQNRKISIDVLADGVDNDGLIMLVAAYQIGFTLFVV